MKKHFILYKLLLISLPAVTQVTVAPGAQWINTGNVAVNFSNIDMMNNGTFTAGNSSLKFTGTSNNNIGGSSPISLYELEVNKTGGSSVALLSNVNIINRVNFVSGLLDLN